MAEQALSKRRRSRRTLWVLGLLACLGAIGFAALGVWQIERLAWKNELVAAVEARSTAAPLDLNAADWTGIDPEQSVYQRVAVTGQFENANTFVQAVTDHGGGFWVMTPLALPDGRTILVNRGFVPPDQREAVAPASGERTITGLLRQSEPGGGFLRANDPQGNRWFSRDVEAIGTSGGLQNLAPFFIDADRTADAYPIGGLTVLTFSNNHLVYALTWFGLCAMLIAALGYLVWDWRRNPPETLHDD